MNKRIIVIASVLKPVDDTRMFEKFGMSLSDSGEYEVVIIGYPSKGKPAYPNIRFIPLAPFSRLSFLRLIAPLKVMLKTFQVKHDILIVNTHELLIVGLLNRILFGRRIIYDIRENYYRNILHTNAFPKPWRLILALWVRGKEKITAPFFYWFFLAEKGYEIEFSFTGKRITILENKPKVSILPKRTAKSLRTHLLFSGTLAESTGVFEAILLARKLHQHDPSVTLHLIGYAAQHETYLHIKREVDGCDFIRLTGGNYLIPHREIMDAISQADFGIIVYPSSPHTQNSMPTKLYEYVAAQLPVLVQNHQPWVEFCQPFQAAIVISETIDPALLLSQMKASEFYTSEPKNVSWSTEEAKLLRLLKSI